MKCCDTCKKNRWMTLMTNAACGHGAVRGGMKLCNDCAVKQDRCEACGVSLAPPSPAPGQGPPARKA
jgi:hypothetical protein